MVMTWNPTEEQIFPSYKLHNLEGLKPKGLSHENEMNLKQYRGCSWNLKGTVSSYLLENSLKWQYWTNEILKNRTSD